METRVHPDPVSDSRNAGEKPAARVFRQLLEAFVSESIFPRERLRILTVMPADRFSRMELVVCGKRLSFDARFGAFGRFEVRKNSPVNRECGTPAGLAEAIALVDDTDADERRKEKLRKELGGTVWFCDRNETHSEVHKLLRRELPYEDLDAAVHEGHPYHPCFKSRTGFGAEDHRNYGPESARTFRLEWLAVRRDRLRAELPCGERAFWLREIGDITLRELESRMNIAGVSIGTHSPMPVHPWQWKTVATRYSREIQSGMLVPLGPAGDLYGAMQSLRTLMNRSRPEAASVKLPMSLVNTSSLRTFEAPLVPTAPGVSEWLSKIIATDRKFSALDGFDIQKEYAALLYLPDATDDHLKHGELGAIFRESVRLKIRPGETAVPFNALALYEPDGLPFIHPWVEKHGLEEWLLRLFAATIPPVLRLLVLHGVAIEAHAQNLVLVHRDGVPTRVIARDFHESLEYSPEYPATGHPHLPDFATIAPEIHGAESNRFYRMDSTESLRELFMDTVFVYNLVDLERVVRHAYGFSETTFWALAGRFLGEGDPLGFRAPVVRTESLMRKKLFGDRADEFHHRADNPFFIP